MIFMFSFVNVVYHLDQIVDVEPSLCLWNEPHVIVMNYFVTVWLYSICQYFVWDFASVFIRDIGLWLSILVLSLPVW